jgi:CRISPR-associated protein Csd1
VSWLLKLFETYERCAGHEPDGAPKLMPIGHTPQQAHIEIALDGLGNLKRAGVIPKVETVMPATEKSATRASGEAAHPLADKVQYVAKDYPAFGGKKKGYFPGYLKQLEAWCGSSSTHPKARAVLSYVRKGTVVNDLVEQQVLSARNGVLLTNWDGDGPEPPIFKQLTAKKDGDTKSKDQGDALIRWVVETEPGEPAADTWTDPSLHRSWEDFYASQLTQRGTCAVTGLPDSLVASQHPARLRNAADKAKLLSSNDTNGYTFRGRFHDADEALSVGFEVTQKAHNALRWLIARQSYRNEEQVIVSWSVGGEEIPDPFMDSLRLTTALSLPADTDAADTAQAFALRLKRSLAGYGSKLDPDADIVVMALNSTSGMQGRMAISYYRELKGSEFLDRIEAWHTKVAWHQNFGKDSRFVGAPAPRDIVEAAFGRRVDDRLLKSTVERLLPCIVDGQAIPHDLVLATSRRASNRSAFKPNERWKWEKCLGIACALFKGHHTERNYQMSLEPDRTTRDYLYGCLLAIAENIESSALFVAGEKRDTNAARLMQRFADRPFSTWRTIEISLVPYKSRLRAQRGGLLFKREQLLDDTMAKFKADDYVNDGPLTGEFLLGYHCQRQDLRSPKPNAEGAGADSSTPDNDE